MMKIKDKRSSSVNKKKTINIQRNIVSNDRKKHYNLLHNKKVVTQQQYDFQNDIINNKRMETMNSVRERTNVYKKENENMRKSRFDLLCLQSRVREKSYVSSKLHHAQHKLVIKNSSENYEKRRAFLYKNDELNRTTDYQKVHKKVLKFDIDNQEGKTHTSMEGLKSSFPSKKTFKNNRGKVEIRVSENNFFDSKSFNQSSGFNPVKPSINTPKKSTSNVVTSICTSFTGDTETSINDTFCSSIKNDSLRKIHYSTPLTPSPSLIDTHSSTVENNKANINNDSNISYFNKMYTFGSKMNIIPVTEDTNHTRTQKCSRFDTFISSTEKTVDTSLNSLIDKSRSTNYLENNHWHFQSTPSSDFPNTTPIESRELSTVNVVNTGISPTLTNDIESVEGNRIRLDKKKIKSFTKSAGKGDLGPMCLSRLLSENNMLLERKDVKPKFKTCFSSLYLNMKNPVSPGKNLSCIIKDNQKEHTKRVCGLFTDTKKKNNNTLFSSSKIEASKSFISKSNHVIATNNKCFSNFHRGFTSNFSSGMLTNIQENDEKKSQCSSLEIIKEGCKTVFTNSPILLKSNEKSTNKKTYISSMTSMEERMNSYINEIQRREISRNKVYTGHNIEKEKVDFFSSKNSLICYSTEEERQNKISLSEKTNYKKNKDNKIRKGCIGTILIGSLGGNTSKEARKCNKVLKGRYSSTYAVKNDNKNRKSSQDIYDGRNSIVRCLSDTRTSVGISLQDPIIKPKSTHSNINKFNNICLSPSSGKIFNTDRNDCNFPYISPTIIQQDHFVNFSKTIHNICNHNCDKKRTLNLNNILFGSTDKEELQEYCRKSSFMKHSFGKSKETRDKKNCKKEIFSKHLGNLHFNENNIYYNFSSGRNPSLFVEEAKNRSKSLYWALEGEHKLEKCPITTSRSKSFSFGEKKELLPHASVPLFVDTTDNKPSKAYIFPNNRNKDVNMTKISVENNRVLRQNSTKRFSSVKSVSGLIDGKNKETLNNKISSSGSLSHKDSLYNITTSAMNKIKSSNLAYCSNHDISFHPSLLDENIFHEISRNIKTHCSAHRPTSSITDSDVTCTQSSSESDCSKKLKSSFSNMIVPTNNDVIDTNIWKKINISSSSHNSKNTYRIHRSFWSVSSSSRSCLRSFLPPKKTNNNETTTLGDKNSNFHLKEGALLLEKEEKKLCGTMKVIENTQQICTNSGVNKDNFLDSSTETYFPKSDFTVDNDIVSKVIDNNVEKKYNDEVLANNVKSCIRSLINKKKTCSYASDSDTFSSLTLTQGAPPLIKGNSAVDKTDKDAKHKSYKRNKTEDIVNAVENVKGNQEVHEYSWSGDESVLSQYTHRASSSMTSENCIEKRNCIKDMMIEFPSVVNNNIKMDEKSESDKTFSYVSLPGLKQPSALQNVEYDEDLSRKSENDMLIMDTYVPVTYNRQKILQSVHDNDEDTLNIIDQGSVDDIELNQKIFCYKNFLLKSSNAPENRIKCARLHYSKSLTRPGTRNLTRTFNTNIFHSLLKRSIPKYIAFKD